MLCKFCGREVPDHSVFCLTCGKEIDRTDLSEVDIAHESTQPMMTPDTNDESPLVEKPTTTPEKKGWMEKLRKNRKFLIGIGVAVLAACVFASCVKGLGGDNEKIPTIEPTESTDAIESDETTQETENSWYEFDWTKQSAELQRLNDLSVEDFRNEPLENQLLYYSVLNDAYYNFSMT